jgi:glycosyltransferase involved in cell wall biosynthesis
MIVKNEAAILERCLQSVRPLISYWVVSDTGSTDESQAVIRRALQGIPGELHEDPWTNFGVNRTLGLQRARGKGDYHLLIDADMEVHLERPLPQLDADGYLVRFQGRCDYSVIRLVSDRHAWSYSGVTHEYVHADTALHVAKLPQLTIAHHEDGGSRSVKYQRDIVLLEQGVQHEPENSRYAYYLAQSYRDTRQFDKALEWYQKRAVMGGWEEEAWHAAYQVGKMQAELHADWRMVLNTYLEAYNFRPWRLEPIFHVANFYREQGKFAMAYLFARLITEVPYPSDDILFIERDVYEHLLPLEYAMCCQGLGRGEEARTKYEQLLSLTDLPPISREVASRNLALLKL